MTHTAHRGALAAAALGLALLGAAPALPAPLAHAATRVEAGAAATQRAGEVAQGAEQAQQKLPDTSKLTPLTANDLEEGDYKVQVASSSSMFRITDATLHVKGGEMTCDLTMSGTGYGKLFMGTGEAAAKADEKDCIPYRDNDEGTHSFTVPVEALDAEVPCAAWSIKKQAWYDRTLVFMADTLQEAPAAQLADGTYSAQVALEGGTGRASVESPCTLTVKDGAVWAHVVWSSPNYDQMVVAGEQYLPVNEKGDSEFDIPVADVDAPLAVQAETVAMSEPHMIDYTLTFSDIAAQKG